MIDPTIIETCDQGQALRCIHVGFLCTKEDSSLRPSMSTVTLMLLSDSVTLSNPTKPDFVRSQVSRTTNSTSYIVSPPSNADASINILVPR